jgi:hypothetical protein
MFMALLAASMLAVRMSWSWVCLQQLWSAQDVTEAAWGEEQWQVAPSGSVPNMEAAGDPGGPAATMIPQMDPALLEVRKPSALWRPSSPLMPYLPGAGKPLPG